MELVVGAEEAGQRLDVLLASRVPELSRMHLRQLLDDGRVRVDGEPRPAGWRVPEGASVQLEIDLSAATAMTPEAIPLEVLFEDETLVVVNKPAGMVAHPVARHRSGTLVNALAHHFNVVGGANPPIRPGLVHRLDRATSGLMVVAKTQIALSRLTVQFQQKQVRKEYLALVHGRLLEDAGDWAAPIGSDPEAWPRWGIRETGRPAHTRFRVRERLTAHTLLELEPVTGRTNQLRLHTAHFGHPIAGDDLFGRGMEPGLSRLFLHAAILEFTHPCRAERCRFESPISGELSAFLTSLRQQEAPRE